VPDFVVGIIERKLETVYQMQQAGQLNITYENMRKVEGLIILGYYHDRRIVGGNNIRYYDINLGVKTFCALLCLIARIIQ